MKQRAIYVKYIFLSENIFSFQYVANEKHSGKMFSFIILKKLGGIINEFFKRPLITAKILEYFNLQTDRKEIF